MNTENPRRTPTRWFWALALLAVTLVGALSHELAAPLRPAPAWPSPRSGSSPHWSSDRPPG